MDQLDAIRMRRWISKVEAKLALAEIEAADCTREIGSPRTSAERRDGAVVRRENAEAKCSALRAELDVLRRSYPNIANH